MPYPLLSRLFNPYGPVATFLTQGVQPPAAQYIGPSDQLQLTVLSPNVDVTLMLGLRLLDLKGQVSPLQYKVIVPATGATPFVQVITPGECFILSATVGQANVRRGQSYCTLLLQRGQPTEGAAVGDVLISGYPSNTDTLGFPQTPATSSVEGRGAVLVYTGAIPAVNTYPKVTCPPGTRWTVISASAQLNVPPVLSSPVAITITTASGATKLFPTYAGANAFTTAAGALRITASANGLCVPTPMVMNAGDVVSIQDSQGVPTTPNQYSALSVTVEEFAEI